MVVVALSLLASALTVSTQPFGHRHGGVAHPTGTDGGFEDRRLASSGPTAAGDEAPLAQCPHSQDCHCGGLHMAALLGTAPSAAVAATQPSQVLQLCGSATVLGRPTARTARQPRAPPRFT